MKAKWLYPIDPQCPTILKFVGLLYDRPNKYYDMSIGDVWDMYSREHYHVCKRCQQHFHDMANRTQP